MLENPQIIIEGPKNVPQITIIEIFKLFFDEKIWDLFEEQSNIYLLQCKEDKKAYLEQHQQSRLGEAKPVTRDELKRWFAIRMLLPLQDTQIKGKILINQAIRKMEYFSSPIFILQKDNESR